MAVTRKRVPAVCVECGKPFQAVLYDVQRGWGKVCSRTCRASRGARALGQALGKPSPERHSLQVRTAGLVNMRIRRGRLARPDHCSQCGKPCKPDGHHDDYLKPAEVLWLCRSCHMKRHFQLAQKFAPECPA